MERLLRPILGFFSTTTRVSTVVSEHVGGMSLLVARSARALVTGRVRWRDISAQMVSMGINSLPLVLVTGTLSGVVTSQQGGYQFTSNIPLYILGSVVTSSVIIELGPVLTAIVVIGRVGARITAELGTMQVSEQIDALYALGRDPISSLATPRIVAGIVTMPVLVGFANGIGVVAGLIAARYSVGLGGDAFLYGARMYFHSWDVFYGMMKAVTFGFMIPVISVHMGLRTRGGAEGVGRSTTASVVFMIITVLVLDAMFPPLLLN